MFYKNLNQISFHEIRDIVNLLIQAGVKDPKGNTLFIPRLSDIEYEKDKRIDIPIGYYDLSDLHSKTRKERKYERKTFLTIRRERSKIGIFCRHYKMELPGEIITKIENYLTEKGY
jgi:hypothetical protein